jgi:hypothetical protein
MREVNGSTEHLLALQREGCIELVIIITLHALLRVMEAV